MQKIAEEFMKSMCIIAANRQQIAAFFLQHM